MTNIELKNKLLDIVNNYKTIYGMGTWGWIVTKSAIERKKKESSWWTTSRINTISKVIDKNYFMFDCIGLIKGILWGWNGNSKAIYGGAGYNINKVPDVNTEGMLAKCTNVSTNFKTIEIGEYLWMSGHCAIYIGDGLCVECTPKWTNNVQITAVANIGNKKGYNSRNWTKHGKLPYITYLKEESKTYKIIVEKIPTYTNSENAKNKKNPIGTYKKDTYFIFNEANGMINITKIKNTPGAWINPNDNIIKENIENPIEETPVSPEMPVEPEIPIDVEIPIEEPNTTPPIETPEESIEENPDENKENIFIRIFKLIISFISNLFKK